MKFLILLAAAHILPADQGLDSFTPGIIAYKDNVAAAVFRNSYGDTSRAIMYVQENHKYRRFVGVADNYCDAEVDVGHHCLVPLAGVQLKYGTAWMGIQAPGVVTVGVEF